MPTEKIISLNNLDRYDKNLKTVAGILQRSTAYALGDVVHNKNIYLKCTTAGTTKATTLDLTSAVKDATITDGTVVWTVTSTTGPASGESSGAGLEDWESNHSYKTDELFVYEGQIYKVLNNFTSGATFEETSDIEAYVPQELTNQQVKNLIDNFVPSGSGTTPVFYDDNAVGTIKAYMGITAPRDYLACDGTIYNIADYKELAEHIKTQFGSYNFFGGDGITTFAVPDLRGEFLRGSGTNSHANQGSGASVGVHQDGTEHQTSKTNANNAVRLYYTDGTKLNYNNYDANGLGGKPSSYTLQLTKDGTEPNQGCFYTSRPTNTSVLYCIKYNTSVLSTPENNYSTEEQRIGTWIDGKPLYQKTIIDTMPTVIVESTRVGKDIDISNLNVDIASYIYGVIKSNSGINPLNSANMLTNNQYSYSFLQIYKKNSSFDTLFVASSRKTESEQPCYITLQYTKTTD